MTTPMTRLLMLACVLIALVGYASAGLNPEVIEQIRADLKSSDPNTRARSMGLLFAEGEKLMHTAGSDVARAQVAAQVHELTRPLRTEVIRAAHDADRGVRTAAAAVLGFGYLQPDDEIIAVLVDLAREDDPTIRYDALVGIALMGRDVPAARTLVLELLDSKRAGDFANGAGIAGQWQMKEAVPALISGLTACDPTTKEAAAKALGAIGSPAASAIPALQHELYELELVTPVFRHTLEEIRKVSTGAPKELATPTTPPPSVSQRAEATPTRLDAR